MSKPSVLVTGASGLLGRDVIRAFEAARWRTVGTGLTRANPPAILKLDLLNKESVKAVLDEASPNVVVHCAANRFPDSIEANPEAAAALNVESTKFLTAECQKRDILVIYISTDYVFPGRPGEAPYKVTDKPNPPNAYGQTKYEGEQAVLEVTDKPGKVMGVILRVPLLYGHCEQNDKSKSAVHPLIDAIYKASQLGPEDPKIKIDDYALRFPTCTEDVGRILANISDKYSKQTGDEQLPRILQFSSEQKYTKWDMTKILAEILGLPTDKLQPYDQSKDPSEGATQRPYDSHLDTSVLKDLGISVATQDFVGWWRKDLKAYRH